MDPGGLFLCLQRNTTGPLHVPQQYKPSFHVYNETPLVPIIYHKKHARIFKPTFFRYILIFYDHLHPSFPIVSFPSGFRSQPLFPYSLFIKSQQNTLVR